MGDTHVVGVPGLGELITVIDEAFSSVNDDLVSTKQVGWSVVFLFLERHTWAMGEYWCLGKLLFLQKHWEWESSRVLGIDFFDLDSSVGKEVVENVVFITTIVGSILPEDMEAKNFSIVVEEALKGFVWSSTLKLDFDVVFHLSLIWRGLLEVDHFSSMGEKILWVCLWGTKGNSLIGKESSSEIIAVNDSENSLVDIKVGTDVEITPEVVLGLVFWVWELVSLQEDTLWDSGVLNSWLNDVDGVIVEVVVDDALSNSVVLVGIFNNWLLEIAVEA